MSSEWGVRNAGNAVDGVLTFDHNQCSNTQLNDIQPWWKTDLQDVFRIEYIVVRNARKYSVQNAKIKVAVSVDKQGTLIRIYMEKYISVWR